MNLFHYTGETGRLAIGDVGSLSPGEHGIIWLTDLPHPVPATALLLHPDETIHRYRVVDQRNVKAWIIARNAYPDELVWDLELRPGGQPAHWFISTVDVPVVYAPVKK